jgi:superoxide dismutase, Cu-Zn family
MIKPIRSTLLVSNVSIALFALGCAKDSPRGMSPGDDTRTQALQAASGNTQSALGAEAAGHHDHAAANTAANSLGVANAPNSGNTTGVQSGRDAEATFKSVPQMKVEGDADLEEVAGGVRLSIEVEHAPPGQKGIHIHQTDNCSDIANKSMGEHFAPTMPKHGLPGAAEHHLGDLGNITIEQNGEGKLDITVAGANLKPGDPLSFIGRSIVLHESNDKGTGPSGDSGKPIACAPIRAD